MGTWEDLKNLIVEAERALFRLQVDDRVRSASVLRDDSSGMYTREYLAHRLPAEVYRFRISGRPFTLALLRFNSSALPEGERWKRLFITFLRPMDVPIRYSDSEALFLFPETSESEAQERVTALADGIALLGLGRRGELSVGIASTGPASEALSAGAMLDELEAKVAPIGKERTPASEPGPEVSGSPDAGHASLGGEVDGEPPARTVSEPLGRPVAVGFAPGRSLPVSFWDEGELRRVQAVLDESGSAGEVLVLTDAGPYYLLERSSRWFARPYTD